MSFGDCETLAEMVEDIREESGDAAARALQMMLLVSHVRTLVNLIDVQRDAAEAHEKSREYRDRIARDAPQLSDAIGLPPREVDRLVELARGFVRDVPRRERDRWQARDRLEEYLREWAGQRVEVES